MTQQIPTDEDRFRKEVRSGTVFATRAIFDVIFGEWNAQDPLNIQPESFLPQVYHSLDYDERAIYREALIDILRQYSNGDQTLSFDQLASILYLSISCALAQRHRSEMTRYLRNALNRLADNAPASDDPETELQAELILKYLASAALIHQLPWWRSVYSRSPRYGYVCFSGMASQSIASALEWAVTSLPDPDFDLVIRYGVSTTAKQPDGIERLKRALRRLHNDYPQNPRVDHLIHRLAWFLDRDELEQVKLRNEIISAPPPTQPTIDSIAAAEIADRIARWDAPLGPGIYPDPIPAVLALEEAYYG